MNYNNFVLRSNFFKENAIYDQLKIGGAGSSKNNIKTNEVPVENS